jgi:hypothetical protein
MAPESAADLGWLLKGVGLERFLGEWYERAPLHLKARPKGHYDRLLKPASLDVLIAQSRDFLAANLEIHPVPTPRTDGTALPAGVSQALRDAQALRAALAQGSTLVLRHAEACWLPLQHLNRAIMDRLTAACSATLFLTPPGHRGFPLHFDIYDAFILQIEGAKEWRIYPPEIVLPYGRLWRPLPLRQGSGGQVDGTGADGTGADGTAPKPLATLTLEPGDLLYLPRGFGHAARATSGAGATTGARATKGAAEESGGARPSLHVSYAFHPYLWRDLLVDLIDEAAETDAALRHLYPGGVHAVGAHGKAGVPPRVAALLKALGNDSTEQVDQARLDQAWSRGRARLIETLDPLPDALHGPAPKPVTRTTDRVTRAPGAMASLRRQGDSLILTFPGDTLRAPLTAEPALRFIAAATGVFKVADLPGRLSARSKVLLVRKLVERGMLRKVG